MKALKIFIILLFCFILQKGNIYGQKCSDYLRTPDCKLKDKWKYTESTLTKAGMVEIKKKFQYKITLYSNRDYKLFCCADKKYFPIHFTIYDNSGDSILYDNEWDNYIESIGFAMDFTTSATIEVSLLSNDFEPEDLFDKYTCFGIMILWRKIPKLGFN